jgi:hypothetical protein
MDEEALDLLAQMLVFDPAHRMSGKSLKLKLRQELDQARKQY